MKVRNKSNYVYFSDLESILDDLGIRQKRYEFCGVTSQQYGNWRRKGTVPADKFWAFQQSLTVFLTENWLRKMVRVGIIEKEFLRELLNEEEDDLGRDI